MGYRFPTLLRSVRLAAVALAAFVPAASAAQRFAAPAGTGTTCSSASPCEVEIAVQGASTGDEVIVLPGHHQIILPFALFAADVTVRGADNQPRPVISWEGLLGETHAMRVVGANAVLRDLIFRGNLGTAGDFDGLLVGNGAAATATLDRVVVDQTGLGVAVSGARWTITNSVLRSAGGDGAILSGSLIGSTVIAPAAGNIGVRVSSGFDPPAAHLVVRNSILRGGSGVGGADLSTDNAGTPSQSATANVDYSAYTTGRLIPSGVGTTTIVAGANNVLAVPLLADLAAGTDVHQLAGSPTIDRGDPASVVGAFDYEGDVRTVGAPDIGADEFVPPPVATTGAATAISPTTATVNGTVNTFSRAGTVRFEYGTTAAYGSVTAESAVGASLTPAAVSAGISGLVPNTTYHVRLVATTDRGTTQGLDVTFTTPGVDEKPTLTNVSLTNKRFRVGARPAGAPVAPSGTRIRLTVSEPATMTLGFQRVLPGRTVGGRCRPVTRANTRRPKCIRLVVVGGLSRSFTTAGAKTVVFSGRIGAKRLVPGSYRVTLRARDGAGQLSTKVIKAFTIIR